jgi:hypothetical protein
MMSTTQATPDTSGTSYGSFEERNIRPIQAIAPPPRTTAVARVAERLERELSHSREAAIAIAEAVEDPRTAREQLSRLSRIPVRGGTLYALDTRVNAMRMMIDPTNPRTVGATDYPASAVRAARAKYWVPRDLTVDPTRPAELRLNAGSPQDVMDALDDAKSVLRNENPLAASIAVNGVFFPLIVMPWIIVTEDDGAQPMAVLVARDGSSRLNGAQENLGIAPSDPLYGPVSDPRRSRSSVKEVSDIVHRRQDEISSEDAAKAHSLMVPARIIVAYEPDPGSEVDLLDVVDELVALVHLDRPTPWSPPSEANKRSDIVLGELVEEGVLSRRQAEYFAGMVDRTRAHQVGLATRSDERAAEILHFFASDTQTAVGKAISRGIRGLTRAAKVTKEDKSKIFTPLILRGHHWASANLRKSAESTLPRAYIMPAFWDRPWSITNRTPEELRDAALREVHSGHPGRSALELTALGVFWLGVYGGLGRESYGQSGNTEPDNRSPNAVLALVMSREHGIHVLYQAIVDGRADQPPRRVDEQGNLAPDGTGMVPAVTNAWLRETFRVKPATTKPGSNPNWGRPTPAEQLQRSVQSIRWKASDLAQQVAALRDIHGDGGVPLVDEVGIPMRDVRAITEEFNIAVAEPLWGYGGIHQARQSVHHATPETRNEEVGGNVDIEAAASPTFASDEAHEAALAEDDGEATMS